MCDRTSMSYMKWISKLIEISLLQATLTIWLFLFFNPFLQSRFYPPPCLPPDRSPFHNSPALVSKRMSPLASLLPRASCLSMVKCIFFHWAQIRQISAVYVLWASYQLVYAPGLWLSAWEISGVQVSWDCWSSHGTALLLSFFHLFPQFNHRSFYPFVGC